MYLQQVSYAFVFLFPLKNQRKLSTPVVMRSIVSGRLMFSIFFPPDILIATILQHFFPLCYYFFNDLFIFLLLLHQHLISHDLVK